MCFWPHCSYLASVALQYCWYIFNMSKWRLVYVVYFHFDCKQRAAKTMYQIWDYNFQVCTKKKCRRSYTWWCCVPSNSGEDGRAFNIHKVGRKARYFTQFHFLFNIYDYAYTIYIYCSLVSSHLRRMNGF